MISDTVLGAYWTSKKNYRFEHLISFSGGPFLDVNVDRPQHLGIDVANITFMDGKSLVTVDVLSWHAKSAACPTGHA